MSFWDVPSAGAAPREPGDLDSAMTNFVRSDQFLAILQNQYRDVFKPAETVDVPTGVISPFAGKDAPADWLLCNGSEVSINDYPDLYEVLRYSNWGTPSSSSVFVLPDLRGRVPMGAGTGTGLTARALAATTGTETHTLSTAQIPSHTHTLGPGQSFGTNFGGNPGAFATFGLSVGVINQATYQGPYEAQANGGGGSHPNVQPSLVLNYIIRT